MVKNFIIGFLTIMLIAVLACAGHHAINCPYSNNEDSCLFTKLDEDSSVYELVLNSEEEALVVQDQLVTDFKYDSIFRTMPPEMVKQVWTKLHNQGIKTISSKCIVDDYCAYQEVYDNLHKHKQSVEPDSLPAIKQDNKLSEQYSKLTVGEEPNHD